MDPGSALVYTWKVGTDPWNSDHYPIFIEYNGKIEPKECSRKASRLHNKHTDWSVFMDKVIEKIREVKTHDGWNRERDVKERYDHLIQIIKGKVADTTPKRKSQNNFGNGGHGTTGNRGKQPACIWWNNECDKVTRIRKAKLLKWKYCKTEETFMEYKKAAVIAKNRLREIKQDYWKNFCDGLNQFTNPSYVWDRMKRLKYRFNKTDRERECKEELINSAITTFGKLCSGVDEPNQAPAFEYGNQDSFLDSEYTIQELL